jgi:HAD superfamily hydrolase (TIGR01484 family)
MSDNYLVFVDIDNTLGEFLHPPYKTSGLQELNEFRSRHYIPIITVTGRRLEEVVYLLNQFPEFPRPIFNIGEVGTAIHFLVYNNESLQKCVLHEEYRQYLISLHFPKDAIASLMEEFYTNFDLQPEENQGEFKLSYYFDDLQNEMAYRMELQKMFGEVASVVVSANYHERKGFVDFLPYGVSKVTAIQFLLNSLGNVTPIFAGDSGNDLAAMELIPNFILVGNASSEFK